MAVEYQFLNKEQFPDIYKCLVEAFADYHLDMSYMNETSMFNRTVKNGVDFEASVGVFDQGKMVGCTLIGIDQWEKGLSAYDAVTGIIPDYRGKGIAREMFNFSIPGLEKKGVKSFLLEVLQVNEAGVKAYQKTGFRISREFDCFEMEKPLENFKPPREKPDWCSIQAVGKDMLDRFSHQLEWRPSWENSFSSIARIPDKVDIYGAFIENQCVGLLVYYPGLEWLQTVLVEKEHRRKGIATALVSHCIANLDPDTRKAKAVNILSTDTATKSLFLYLGFQLYVSQYEMEFDIGD
ncbi:MAG: GNAT family N-acetyltransferase [bacterium]|nr:GNAT family N-acetyltransferase [bacterium]